MTDKPFHPDGFADLRRRAEESTKTGDVRFQGPLSSDEAKRLVHELEVHQNELETQNEELRRSQSELESSRARYFDQYDLAPVGYFTLNENGIIREGNVTGAVLLGMGRSDLVNQPLTRFILPEDQDIYYRHRKELLATRSPQVCELRMVRKDAATFWARLAATPPQDDGSGTPACRTVMSDITDRKAAEELLRANEEFQRDVLNALSAHIAVLDHDGEVIAINSSWERFGRENGATGTGRIGVGANYLEICRNACGDYNDESKAALEGIQSVLSGNRPSFSLEYPCHSPELQRWFLMQVTRSRPYSETDFA